MDEKGWDDIGRDIYLDLKRLKSRELLANEKGFLEINLYDEVLFCYCFGLPFSFSIAQIEASDQCVLQNETKSEKMKRVSGDKLSGLSLPPPPNKKRSVVARDDSGASFTFVFVDDNVRTTRTRP